jgi:cytochrome P450
MFNQPAIIVADTKIIQDITLNHVYDFIKPPNMWTDAVKIIGKGLVLAEGDEHKRQRKMMNPAFTHNNVKVIIPNS